MQIRAIWNALLKDTSCRSIGDNWKSRELSDEENVDGTREGRQRRGTRRARANPGHHACVLLMSKRYRYPCVLRNARAHHSCSVGFCHRTCRVFRSRRQTKSKFEFLSLERDCFKSLHPCRINNNLSVLIARESFRLDQSTGSSRPRYDWKSKKIRKNCRWRREVTSGRDAGMARTRNFRGIWWTVEGSPMKKCGTSIRCCWATGSLCVEIVRNRYSCLFFGRSWQPADNMLSTVQCHGDVHRNYHVAYTVSLRSQWSRSSLALRRQ